MTNSRRALPLILSPAFSQKTLPRTNLQKAVCLFCGTKNSIFSKYKSSFSVLLSVRLSPDKEFLDLFGQMSKNFIEQSHQDSYRERGFVFGKNLFVNKFNIYFSSFYLCCYHKTFRTLEDTVFSRCLCVIIKHFCNFSFIDSFALLYRRFWVSTSFFNSLCSFFIRFF